MARLGSAAHSVLLLMRTTLTPASSKAIATPSSRAARAFSLKPLDDNRDVGLFQSEATDDFNGERAALPSLLRADIAAPIFRHDLRHGHVLVHHLDARFRGFLRKRHDRGVARVARSSRCHRAWTERPRATAAPSSRGPNRRKCSRQSGRGRARPAWRRCRRWFRRHLPPTRRRRSANGRPCTICRPEQPAPLWPRRRASRRSGMRLRPPRKPGANNRRSICQTSPFPSVRPPGWGLLEQSFGGLLQPFFLVAAVRLSLAWTRTLKTASARSRSRIPSGGPG